MTCQFCDQPATHVCDYLGRVKPVPVPTPNTESIGGWLMCDAHVCAEHSNPHRVPLGAGSAVKHLCPDHNPLG